MKEPVRLTGILKGQGVETTCTIQAVKVSLPGSGAAEYANMWIVETAKAVPEGDYQLLAGGKSNAMRYKDGEWLSAAG